MVCIVCYDPLLGPGKPSRTNRSRSSNAARLQPAALNCGHVFHKACINRWISSSSDRACPLCHRYHAGPALVLYIDADDTNNNTSQQQQQQQSATSSSSSYTMNQALDIDRLCECFDELGMDVPEQSHHTGYDDYCAELLDELVASTAKLVSKHDRDRGRLQGQVRKLTQDLQDANNSADYQQNEIDRLSRLSEAHKRHIQGLQLALEKKKDVIDWYEDKYGYEYEAYETPCDSEDDDGYEYY